MTLIVMIEWKYVQVPPATSQLIFEITVCPRPGENQRGFEESLKIPMTEVMADAIAGASRAAQAANVKTNRIVYTTEPAENGCFLVKFYAP